MRVLIYSELCLKLMHSDVQVYCTTHQTRFPFTDFTKAILLFISVLWNKTYIKGGWAFRTEWEWHIKSVRTTQWHYICVLNDIFTVVIKKVELHLLALILLPLPLTTFSSKKMFTLPTKTLPKYILQKNTVNHNWDNFRNCYKRVGYNQQCSGRIPSTGSQ